MQKEQGRTDSLSRGNLEAGTSEQARKEEEQKEKMWQRSSKGQEVKTQE